MRAFVFGDGRMGIGESRGQKTKLLLIGSLMEEPDYIERRGYDI